ncbi:hypothetical protein CNMCM8927_001565 [Aspergillus lentulus]|uniref:Transcription factor domain-containing protein n=1 Tax=Aspergillus lentulus TaxID=293939 RepID=A0AAN5YHG3_ASPLE|nr:hypothetical protein CNMCM8927_001565 [Aspergillus lentulus]
MDTVNNPLKSWLAADFFNYDLSWDCFRRACLIGRQLGIFTVDAEHMEGLDVPGNHSRTSTDCTLTKSQKRYAFWQLLQTDCLFRQLFGKSPVIPFGSWCVRFPDLPLHPEGDTPQSSLQVYFIVSMRFAFITLRFLEFLDTHGQASEDQVTELVLELKSVVTEWDLERSFRAAVKPTDACLYADLLFSSHLLIISFQQSTKTFYPLQQIPEASLDAARQSIYILEHWSQLPTGNPYNTISLVSSYPVIHIFILLSNILSNPDTTTAEADLSLTLCFGTMLLTVNHAAVAVAVGKPLHIIIPFFNRFCRHADYPYDQPVYPVTLLKAR